ncbi:phage tail protein [Rhodanobacter sp. Col0626]|uniref:phage tail protein n=1 Tax=Rhodanobacter sp. Col0626 TaxID=3415679 RepID=UPI003CF62CEC
MSTPFVGEIRLFAFSRIPTGWFACDGSLQSIAQYEVLYTLLGTTFGGDGVNTFGMPDMRGQVPLHMGNAGGLSPRVLGQNGGSENVTLLPGNLPQHTHPYLATSGMGNAATPSPSAQLGAVSGDVMYASDLTGAHGVALAPTSVGSTGNSGPHENIMPTLTASFCIAWAGIFPSQS